MEQLADKIIDFAKAFTAGMTGVEKLGALAIIGFLLAGSPFHKVIEALLPWVPRPLQGAIRKVFGIAEPTPILSIPDNRES